MSSEKAVLIVEDEGMQAELWVRQLEAAGIPVCGVVSDGRQALEQVKRQRPSLMLLDMILTSCDGLWVLRELQSLEERPRVILASCAINDEITVRAMELGANFILKKPVEPEVLLLRIREQLQSPARERPKEERSAGERRAEKLLLGLNISPRYQGFRPLCTSIALALEAEDWSMKQLGVELCKRYGLKMKTLERNMRYCLAASFEREETGLRRALFGGRRPTVSGLIEKAVQELQKDTKERMPNR